MRIATVTDSTCDLPGKLLEQYGITVLPLHIAKGGQSLLDGIEITPKDIFDYVDGGGEICTTSAVNVFEFATCFQTLGQSYDAIICVTIGSEFSTCYQNACLAAANLTNGCSVYVVDSQNLSSGQGLLVLEAARLARAGFSPDAIVSRLEDVRARVDASFILDRLDYMRKGGRCSAIAVLGANLLQLKPCIEVRDGTMGVGKKYRGSLEKVMVQYVRDRLTDWGPEDTGDIVIVVHPPADDAPLAAARRALEEDGRFAQIWEAHSGCTVACHCGPNTIGVMFLRRSDNSPEKCYTR